MSGIFLYALGACLMAHANIGISAISSVPCLFTILTPATLGTTQFVWSIVLISLQKLALRDDFDNFQYLQLAASVVFCVLLDLILPMVRLMQFAGIYQRVILLIIALVIMAVGLSTAVTADLVIIPGDGMAQTVAKKTGWKFGKAKVTVDLSCVALTCVLSLITLRRLAVVQVGTVLAALLLGNIARIYSNYTNVNLTRFMRLKPAEFEEAG